MQIPPVRGEGRMIPGFTGVKFGCSMFSRVKVAYGRVAQEFQCTWKFKTEETARFPNCTCATFGLPSKLKETVFWQSKRSLLLKVVIRLACDGPVLEHGCFIH